MTTQTNSTTKTSRTTSGQRTTVIFDSSVSVIDGILHAGVHALESDYTVAAAVQSAFQTHWVIPTEQLRASIQSGWVTITGELALPYQKDAVRSLIRHLPGVLGVTNHTTIKSDWYSEIEKADIQAAIAHHWSLDGSNISVEVSEHTVTLHGIVSTFFQKSEAGRLAWNAPGIWSVDNELSIAQS